MSDKKEKVYFSVVTEEKIEMSIRLTKEQIKQVMDLLMRFRLDEEDEE